MLLTPRCYSSEIKLDADEVFRHCHLIDCVVGESDLVPEDSMLKENLALWLLAEGSNKTSEEARWDISRAEYQVEWECLLDVHAWGQKGIWPHLQD